MHYDQLADIPNTPVFGGDSHVWGDTGPALLDVTIGRFLDGIAARFPDREALVAGHQGVRYTYREFARRVDDLAAVLLGLGLKPGDRLGIWAPNCAEWVLTQFATAKAGIVLVTINPAYRAGELEQALNLVGCRALVLSPMFKTSDYIAMLHDLAPEIATGTGHPFSRLPSLEMLITLGPKHFPGMLRFHDLCRSASANERHFLSTVGATLSPDDAINIQFTSGTTGSPKGATLTHRNILNNGLFIGRGMRLSEADRLCIPVPLYHCFGMVIGNLAAITHGAAMVLPGESFDADTVLATVQAERCTGLLGVPTMFIAMLARLESSSYDLSTLRTGMMAGAPCPVDVMTRVVETMNMADVTIGYGMTETSPISFQTAIDEPIDLRVSTVGRVQPHLEVKIVDEDGTVVPRGFPGELWTRGYSVMRGYWGGAGGGVDADGWMHSGDLATIDTMGNCRIIGRAKDMVIRGGENIAPAEVEQFLYGHPAVQDVQVIGVPDARMGEELCACIIAKPGKYIDAEEVRQFCLGRIAHYKIPRYVRVVERFPTTVSGKVQKFVLRSESAQALGLAACLPSAGITAEMARRAADEQASPAPSHAHRSLAHA